MKGFRPKISLFFETGHYELRPAQNIADLKEVFHLRHEIFIKEDQNAPENPYEYEMDRFDFLCDHLLIASKVDGKICGTYRILSSDTAHQFYSQNEFVLDNFLQTEGVKLELGRACIHPAHRNGSVIDLLWKGLGRYAKMKNARYLFGCSSVPTMDRKEALGLYDYFSRSGWLHHDYAIRPTKKYERKFFRVSPMDQTGPNPLVNVPPLLRSYLAAGATVHGAPAFDRAFRCIDFLTILDLNNLSPSYRKRYWGLQ